VVTRATGRASVSRSAAIIAVVDVLPFVPVTPIVNSDPAHVGGGGGGRNALIFLEGSERRGARYTAARTFREPIGLGADHRPSTGLAGRAEQLSITAIIERAAHLTRASAIYFRAPLPPVTSLAGFWLRSPLELVVLRISVMRAIDCTGKPQCHGETACRRPTRAR
jgi:hypothetical protein